jgi:hypothetical protein
MLGFQGKDTETWTPYVQRLKLSAIRIREDDELVWSKNSSSRRFTAKLKYKAKFLNEKEGDQKWWWKSIWKITAPLKRRIFLWLALANKILTWDNCKKRAWQGPERCIFYKNMMRLFRSY